MRVWQPGSHLSDRGKRDKVDDWSFAATKRRIRMLVGLAAPYKLRTALAIGSLLAATAVALLPPFIFKEALDGPLRDGDLTTLYWLVAAFVGAGILAFFASYATTYTTGWTGERMLADLRIRLFAHLQRLSLGFYERNRAGVIVSRLTNDVEAIDQLVTDGFSSLIQNSLTLIGATIILFILNWKLALAVFTVMPFMLAATTLFRIYSHRAYTAVRERIGLVTATLAEDIAGMRVVHAFTREDERIRHFEEINDHYRAANQQTVVANGLYFPFVDLISTAATAIVLGYGGLLVIGETDPGALPKVGVVTGFLFYLSYFFDPVQQLSQLYNTFISAVAALDKITGILDEEPEVVDAPGAQELEQIRGDVSFHDVRFKYQTGPEVLHGLTLDVPAGTTVALVGHTGAGKSTIAKLLARFYDPTAGAITFDGVDISTVTQQSLRRQLGIVPQEGFLFAGTVRENIAFGRPDATDAEIETAAHAVGADELAAELEDGYDTQLQERGSRLSLGQRQLVAFARALLADPRILILDEATSSVDIGTEKKIEEALRTLLAGRTAFIIAHRLSTIREADMIVVLEHGRVVEAGSHQELLAKGGLYTSLYGDWAAVA
jgi:ABC-type multidrug transport system fused ATPase/permease subunit